MSEAGGGEKRGEGRSEERSRMAKPLIGGKRRRPGVEDEVYLDNFHTQKRYLSEVMAFSLNGLRVGETVSNNSAKPAPSLSDPLASPARTDTGCFSRSASSFPSHGDDLSTLDSPMSEDSDESVGYRMVRGVEIVQQAPAESPPGPSCPSSPPRRSQRVPYGGTHNLPAGSSTWTPMRTPYTASHPLPCSRPRSNEAEGRLPPSPSDACQSADLRKAALLRALHRAQSPSRPASSAARRDKVSIPDVQHSVVVQPAVAAEQTGCNSEVLGSPLHAMFCPTAGRNSRVRSLLLDEQQLPISIMATSSSSGNEDQLAAKATSSLLAPAREAGASKALNSLSDSLSMKHDGSLSCSSKDGNVSDTESSFSRNSGRLSFSKTSATRPAGPAEDREEKPEAGGMTLWGLPE